MALFSSYSQDQHKWIKSISMLLYRSSDHHMDISELSFDMLTILLFNLKLFCQVHNLYYYLPWVIIFFLSSLLFHFYQSFSYSCPCPFLFPFLFISYFISYIIPLPLHLILRNLFCSFRRENQLLSWAAICS